MHVLIQSYTYVYVLVRLKMEHLYIVDDRHFPHQIAIWGPFPRPGGGWMPTNENLPVVAVDNADHRCHAETTVGHLKGYSYWFHAQLASDIYIYMPYGYLT